jgi:glutamate synthase (ferredoxin)
LSTIYKPEKAKTVPNHNTTTDHGLENVLDFQIIKEAIPSIYRKEKTRVTLKLKNTDRSVVLFLVTRSLKFTEHKVLKTLF